MTRRSRAMCALLSAAAVLTACSGPPAAPGAGSPTPSLTVSPPASPTGLPTGAEEIAEWAAIALPEDRPGGAGWSAQGSGRVGADGAGVEVGDATGRTQAVIACQSADGSPVTVHVDDGAAGTDTVEVPCTRAGGAPVAGTAMVFDAAPGAGLEVSATAEAVFAYAIRPFTEPGS
ncbi:hypothetical protein [Microbacterium lushaniae]|uniref:Uncharacterized protein n=1 Tax=Microbacterium lushaniae TaxID=2614639 RepID=A0A5J6L7Q9_9MICO|nr:hypothetical protein [Microbacterium lushaniae]QEW04584.1 hypothetical protein F6J85_16830 [Microbacterium lushaniae]